MIPSTDAELAALRAEVTELRARVAQNTRALTDLYALMEQMSRLNKETCETMAATIRQLVLEP